MKSEEEIKQYNKAKEKVMAIKGFYIHLLVYIIVNIGLVVINLVNDPSYLWFVWPLLGWGIGLLGHAIGTFGSLGFLGDKWEEKKIKEIMEKRKEKE